MKAKILEYFNSFQGEGKYAGVRQVFVRFFGCHMHCRWCDTPDSIGDGRREFMELTVAELAHKIRPLLSDIHSVSLTGGEPLLQVEFIKEFIPVIRESGAQVYLETSGVLHAPLRDIIDDVDIVAMDFKLPSSTQCRSFWKEHEEFLKIAAQKDVFIKAVVTSQTAEEDIRTAISLILKTDPQPLFILQPNYFDLGNGVMNRCLEFYKYCAQELTNVRVMPQMHKMMGIK